MVDAVKYDLDYLKSLGTKFHGFSTLMCLFVFCAFVYLCICVFCLFVKDLHCQNSNDFHALDQTVCFLNDTTRYGCFITI